MHLSPEQVCAHRGASGTAPENTMAAFNAACLMPVGSVEFDISLLGDGTALIHHDGVLGRTIKATGTLLDMKIDAFDTLDAGAWFGAEFAGQSVPLLADVLRLLAQHDKMPVLDVKIHANEEVAFADAIAGILAQNLSKPPLVTSFSRKFLMALRTAAPDARLGLLGEALPEDWEGFCDQLAVEAVHLDVTKCTPDDIAAIGKTGRDTRLYTVNDPASVTGHIDAGLTSVITDLPDRFFG